MDRPFVVRVEDINYPELVVRGSKECPEKKAEVSNDDNEQVDKRSYGQYYVSREIVNQKGKVWVYKNNYKGAWYNFGILANRDIKVTALEFYGPAKKKDDDEDELPATHWYDVKTMVTRWVEVPCNFSFLNFVIPNFFKPFWRMEEVSPSRETGAWGKTKRRFVIPFEEPVKLLNGRWYDIRFQLDGPDTCCMTEFKHSATVPLMDGSTVDFTFNGSRQLPAIYFDVD